MSLFALSVNPYITSSIIVQLLAMVIPSLERLMREGVEGRRIVSQYTRYGTIFLAIVQGWAYTVSFRQYIPDYYDLERRPDHPGHDRRQHAPDVDR